MTGNEWKLWVALAAFAMLITAVSLRKPVSDERNTEPNQAEIEENSMEPQVEPVSEPPPVDYDELRPAFDEWLTTFLQDVESHKSTNRIAESVARAMEFRPSTKWFSHTDLACSISDCLVINMTEGAIFARLDRDVQAMAPEDLETLVVFTESDKDLVGQYSDGAYAYTIDYYVWIIDVATGEELDSGILYGQCEHFKTGSDGSAVVRSPSSELRWLISHNKES